MCITENFKSLDAQTSTSSHSELTRSDSSKLNHCARMINLKLKVATQIITNIPIHPYMYTPTLYIIVSQSKDSTSATVSECDIGKLLEQDTDFQQLDRDVKYRILITEPNSDASLYPRTRPFESSSYQCQFQPGWSKSFPWLHYSRHMDGAFCRAGIFFAPQKVGGQNLGSFVTKSFTSWIKMSEKGNAHSIRYP